MSQHALNIKITFNQKGNKNESVKWSTPPPPPPKKKRRKKRRERQKEERYKKNMCGTYLKGECKEDKTKPGQPQDPNNESRRMRNSHTSWQAERLRHKEEKLNEKGNAPALYHHFSNCACTTSWPKKGRKRKRKKKREKKKGGGDGGSKVHNRKITEFKWVLKVRGRSLQKHGPNNSPPPPHTHQSRKS